MAASRGYVLVFSTCPDGHTAERIATFLIESKLAACVNIVGGIRSIYWWQDGVQQDDENLLIIKTHVDRYSAVEEAITQQHPYELPEVVQVPIHAGLERYLAWIGACVAVP